MKKILLLIFICAVSITSLFAQTIYTGQDYILNKPIIPDEEYEGNTEVTLVPGFEYIAATNIGFTARIKGGTTPIALPTTPANYLSMPIDGLSRSLNTSFAIGTISGTPNLTQTGAFTYQIPIALSPGTAGMAPSLSLVYSSQGGNGLCGLGWNIAGLSAITRAPSTMYHDGFVDGVNFNNYKWNYSLDGQRLIKTGADEYRTEAESFAVIKGLGTTGLNGGTGHDYFTVTTKDGFIYEYGKTIDSKGSLAIPNQWNSDVVTWNIDKVTDPNGNYYMVRYYNDPNTGETYPLKIEYTGNSNTGLPTYNEVEFYYKKRIDIKNSYLENGRGRMEQTVILEKVVTRACGNDVLEYTLNYYADDFNTYLNEVQLCNGSDCYNSTIINYGSIPSVVTKLNTTGSINSDSKYAVDIDGDSKTELITLQDINTSGTISKVINFQKYNDFNSSFISYKAPITVPNPSQGLMFGDVDGDGLKETLLIEGTFSPSSLSTSGQSGVVNTSITRMIKGNNMYTTFDNTSNSWGVVSHGFRLKLEKSESNTFGNFYLGDFNGDGKDEVLKIEVPVQGLSTQTSFVIYSVDAWGNFTEISNDLINCAQSDDVRISDFNGDGKMDILVVQGINCNIYSLGGAFYYNPQNQLMTINPWNLTYFPTVNHKIYTGDFNGDGKSDILTYSVLNHVWEFGIWNGQGFNLSNATELNNLGVGNPFDDNSNYNLVCADFNSDGRTDIYFHEKLVNWYQHFSYDVNSLPIAGTDYLDNNPTEYINVGGTLVQTVVPVHHSDNYTNHLLLSVGNGSFITKSDNSDNAVHIAYKNFASPIIGDFNGDGQIDNFNKVSGDNIRFYFKNDVSRLVSSITNGINNTVKIDYHKLSEDYLSVGTTSYPVANIAFPIPIANKIHLNFGTQDEQYIEGIFDRPLIALNGKGFLGFGDVKMKSYHNSGNNYTESRSTNAVDNTYFFLKNSYTYNFTGTLSSPTLISKTIPVVSYFNLGSTGHPRYFLYPNNTTSITYLNGNPLTTTTTQYAYNNDGNLTYSLTDYNGEYSVQTNNTYILKGGNGINPNKLLKSTTVNFKPSSATTITHTVECDYDLIGNLTKQIADQSQPHSITTEFTLNPYGLVISTETYATTGSMNHRYSYNDFDQPKNRFIIHKKNTLNQHSYYTYDAAFGNVLTATDINNHAISNTYGSFGKKLTSTDALGTTTYLSGYSSAITGAFSYASVLPPNTTTASITYFDALGRELQSQSTSYNIAFASKKEYTLDGRLDKSSNVFNVLNTAAKINTQYTYDAQFGYVNSENYNNGVAITTHAVNGLTSTSIAPDGSIFEKTIDAIGNTIIAKDPNGAGGQNQITYEYDAVSHPTKIINPSGTITMQYDAAGRQTQLTDPNAGTTQYAYNDFGELKSQTNAAGLTTTLTYDDLGRPITTTLPEGTITTTYDNKTNGKGMAGTITSNLAGFNNSINYTYDILSRTTQTDEVIGSNTYTHKTVYDATTGRVNQTEYPSGFKLNYTYNADGDVLKISRADNGKTIWEMKHIDDNGRMDEYYVGDNRLLVMKTTYDANQQLQNHSVKKGSTILQNTDYGFSTQTGNLDMRHDNLNTTTTPKEFFGYDAAQQLTKIEIGSTSSTLGNSANSFVMQMDYDAKGNITDKSDVGKYFYYHPQPNALTYVTHRDQTATHTSPTDDYYRDVNAISNNQQDITYNSFEQPVTICENGNTLTLKYGIDKQRIQTILTNGNTTIYQRTFVGDYEEETTSAGARKIHYISGGSGGLVAIYIEANSVGTMYYVLKDHLGSITGLVDETGNIVQKYAYDAWGKRSLTTDNTATGNYVLYRGYTGHECIDDCSAIAYNFSIINMNGRLYDPTIGRMLSTDNYVQGGSQGFNRYSYVHNNPMKYTDPSGELLGYDDLAVAGAGFAFGYVSSGVKTGNWGWGSVKNGLMYGAMFELGYLTGGGSIAAGGGSMAAAGNFLASSAVNMAIGSMMPSIPIYQSENFNLSVSPMIGMGSSGLTMGGSINASGRVGDFTLSGSIGAGSNSGMSELSGNAGGSNYWNFSAGFDYRDRANSTNYGFTFSRNNFFGGKTNQGVAAYRFRLGDFSIRVDEDYFLGSDGGDRYRTGGMLATLKINNDVSLAFGVSMVTGEADKSIQKLDIEKTRGCGMEKNHSTWGCEGEPLRAGIMYGGIIYKGNAMFYGNNTEKREHAVQNRIHSMMKAPGTPYFENFKNPSRGYSYFGNYNVNYLFY
jgi:RHS repeat-associated protein